MEDLDQDCIFMGKRKILVQKVLNLITQNPIYLNNLVIESKDGQKEIISDQLIKSIYAVEILKNVLTFTIPNSKIEVTIIKSPYHLEWDVASSPLKDTLIVQSIITQLAKQCDHSHPTIPFQIFVIKNADLLSNDAFDSLRKTLDDVKNIRLIMTISNNTLSGPILSRCTLLPIPNYTLQEIKEHLILMLKKYKESMPEKLLDDIVKNSNQSLEKAVLQTKFLIAKHSPIQTIIPFEEEPWLEHLRKLFASAFISKELHTLEYIQLRSKYLNPILEQNLPIKDLVSSVTKIIFEMDLNEIEKRRIFKIVADYDLKFATCNLNKHFSYLFEQFVVELISK